METITTAALAQLLGISDRAVRQHVAAGTLVQVGRGRFDRDASIGTYCEHLRAMAAGRGGADGVKTLSAERARLAKEQADQYAIKNAALRGELVSAADVERKWTDACRCIRSAMLAIPSRVRQQLPHLTRTDAALIDDEIRRALTELANGEQAPAGTRPQRPPNPYPAETTPPASGPAIASAR
ncbi:MAG: hypothetical protein U1E66_05250 [Rhodospirillales bacterium]